MKQAILVATLATMFVASSAFASNDDDKKRTKVKQDHTCQGGHNCNTYNGGGSGGTGGSISHSGNSTNLIGVGVDVRNTATGGSVGNVTGSTATVGNVTGVTGSVTGGSATIEKGAVTNTNDNKSSVNNSGNLTIEEGAIQVGPKEIPTETTQNINYSGSTTTNVNHSGTTTVKNVPNVDAAALTSSNDTCMGSTSGGVAVAGFGFSLGSTWSDKNCLMLKNSREMWNMGFKAAAMARMCMDDLNKEALELTGFKCPTKEAK